MSLNQAILVLENDLSSVYLLEKAFLSCGITHPLHIVRYHKEALLYLEGVGIYSDRQKYQWPCALLIDIVYDHANAFEFIKWIRAREKFASVPLVVLVESESNQWIQQAFALGADAFLVKTAGLKSAERLLRTLNLTGSD